MDDGKKHRYNAYSEYLKNKYGQKVYKLPVNLPVTCPNRDGTCGLGGCIYCGEEGAGFENLPDAMPVPEQLERNMKYIRDKYHAEKFIAYFQNFTNTYIPPGDFGNAVKAACMPDIVKISVSTRPDCIAEPYLDILKEVRTNTGMNISIELGVQTVNYHTLEKINRGHTLAEVIEAMGMIKRYGFDACAHLILNLPWDNEADAVETAKVVSALGFDQVKLHALYIVKGTVLGKMYEDGNIKLISVDGYVRRVITFLEYLDPRVIVQRLIGRAPEENTLFVNWNTSWWKIRDMIDEKMEQMDTWQGKRFDYLGGKSVKGKLGG